MTDQQFLSSFRDQSLPEANFDHFGHVRMAWLYLEEGDLIEAIQRFRTDLMAYATALGAPNKYHETITWFYLQLINERRQLSKAETWDEFVAANPDLVRTEDPILYQYYSRKLLKNRRSRKHALLPDLLAKR